MQRSQLVSASDGSIGFVSGGPRPFGIERHHGVDRSVEALHPRERCFEQLPGGHFPSGDGGRSLQSRCVGEIVRGHVPDLLH